MNCFRIQSVSAQSAGCLLLLLAVFHLRAAEPAVGGRWLLIFDSSPGMKKLLPDTEAAARGLFTSSADGQLKTGDSVAAWTFNQQITSQLPPFTWSPNQSDAASTNLAAFLRRQNFSITSRLASLQSPLNRVMAVSPQLTILIFTDGQSDLAGTPYDTGINQTFSEERAKRSSPSQLYVIALRSERGKFVGCTMNFPPDAISLPPFPPLPVVTNKPVPTPPQPIPAPNNTPVNSLVIIGNSVTTNGSKATESFAPKALPTNAGVPAPASVTNPVTTPAMATNFPPAAKAGVTTNIGKSVITNRLETETPKTSPPPTVVATLTGQTTTKTNANASAAATNMAGVAEKTSPPPASEPASSRGMIWAAIGGLVILVVAIALIFGLRRKPQSSLISASMDDRANRH